MAFLFSLFLFLIVPFPQGEEVRAIKVRATALLIGCSSGQLLDQGLFEPAGIIQKYLLAGSPGDQHILSLKRKQTNKKKQTTNKKQQNTNKQASKQANKPSKTGD